VGRMAAGPSLQGLFWHIAAPTDASGEREGLVVLSTEGVECDGGRAMGLKVHLVPVREGPAAHLACGHSFVSRADAELPLLLERCALTACSLTRFEETV
jgi:hypothetical protein